MKGLKKGLVIGIPSVVVIAAVALFVYYVRPFGKPCDGYNVVNQRMGEGFCPLFRCRMKSYPNAPYPKNEGGLSVGYVFYWEACYPTTRNLRKCPVAKVTGTDRAVYTFDKSVLKWSSFEPAFYYLDEVDEKWIQQNCPLVKNVQRGSENE